MVVAFGSRDDKMCLFKIDVGMSGCACSGSESGTGILGGLPSAVFVPTVAYVRDLILSLGAW